MPLLTHDETAAASMARATANGGPAQGRVDPGAQTATTARSGGVALSERPAALDPATRGAPPGAPRSATSKRSSSPWKLVRRGVLILLAVFVLAPFLAFVVGWMIFKVPTADDVALNQVATFTFADDLNVPLATVRPDNENRVKVTLDQVPQHVKDAALAAEDRTFFTNPGFDITGIARAVYSQLTGGVGGGSTITQQYVKVSTDEDDVTLLRKYKEVVVAVKISREQTKEQILENYLNTIFWGRQAYGLQAASKAYFDKDVKNLTPSEGAMLAGLIQAPSNWDPAKSVEDAQRRWTFVADQMAEANFLTPAERAQLVFPDNWLREAPAVGGLPEDDRYHIYDLAVAELADQGITREQIDRDGLTVTTTVSAARQKQAVEAIKEKMEGQPGNLRSSLISIDPKTGAILAYYGGSNGLGTDYAQGLRPAGSTFKPFVFSAALQGGAGVGLGSTFDGTSGQKFAGLERPINNSGESSDCGKECNVKTAMTQSVNTVFYRMGLEVGPQKVIDAAHQAGIPEDLATDPRGGISLGDQEVHPVDMAAAYATFAADGQRREPYIVSKVVAADGRVLFTRDPPEPAAAVPAQVARNVTESMLDVPARSKVTLAGGRVAAAKTGTVQGEGDSNKDAWIVGYTPSIVTAVWVGSDKSDALVDKRGQQIFGGSLPGPIWKTYMDDALAGTSMESFSELVPMGKALGSANGSDGDRSTSRQQPPPTTRDSDDRDQDRPGRDDANQDNGNGNGGDNPADTDPPRGNGGNGNEDGGNGGNEDGNRGNEDGNGGNEDGNGGNEDGNGGNGGDEDGNGGSPPSGGGRFVLPGLPAPRDPVR